MTTTTLATSRSPCHARALLHALLLAQLTGCTSASASSEAEPELQSAVQVGVIALHTQVVPLRTQLLGRTAPYRSAEIRPQVTGIVQARAFEEGSQVAAGQLLYAIDGAVYRAAHKRARAELASARANLAASDMRAKRYTNLVKEHAVSAQEYDDARAAQAQAEAAVQQAEAAVSHTQLELEYTELRAPIPGRIGRSSVTPGALVTAQQSEPLALIQQLDPIYVDLAQSSSELLRLKRLLASGSVEALRAQVRLELEDGAPYTQLGELQFTDITVEPGTGSVTLRALFPNPDGSLLPGMVVRAWIDQAVARDAILAPQRAITRDENGGAIALLVDAKNQVELRSLTTERAIGDSWLVQSGLSAGERLIVEGTDKVRPGLLVDPVLIEERAVLAVQPTAATGG